MIPRKRNGEKNVKLTFHGAAGTVTGSQHEIEFEGKQILLDCGLFQGKRKEAFERNRSVGCKSEGIDLLILSHAHIDHSGRTPCLVRGGYRGDIYCTPATRDLCAAMLLDTAHIQESDVRFVNKRRRKQGKRAFKPLYTKDDVARTMRQFVGIGYDRPREVLPGVRLTLVDAGHMLGSSHVILDFDRSNGEGSVRLVFSGDIGRPGMPILRDPTPIVEGTDLLLVESTYGNRIHPPYRDSEVELRRIVNETVARGGCLLVPAFAVGRTQQLVYALHKLHDEGAIPALPIYVDSPLATRVTDVFRLHPETYDEETRAFLQSDKHRSPFGFGALHYTRSVEESKALNTLREPAIIISASGMMEAGRILHHLRNRIEKPQNTILITGWQAPNTLGRRIVDGEETIKIFGEEFHLEAHVEILTGFSAHADREGLLEWAGAMKKKPRRTFVIHGEPRSAGALAEGLRTEHQFSNVEVPELGETITID